VLHLQQLVGGRLDDGDGHLARTPRVRPRAINADGDRPPRRRRRLHFGVGSLLLGLLSILFRTYFVRHGVARLSDGSCLGKVQRLGSRGAPHIHYSCTRMSSSALCTADWCAERRGWAAPYKVDSLTGIWQPIIARVVASCCYFAPVMYRPSRSRSARAALRPWQWSTKGVLYILCACTWLRVHRNVSVAPVRRTTSGY
jgi:hypothetical protein